MPYSITTKDGITIQNIPDDVPPDAPQLQERVAKVRAGGNMPAQQAPSYDPTEGMSGVDKLLAGTGKAFSDVGLRAKQLLIGREGNDELFIDRSKFKPGTPEYANELARIKSGRDTARTNVQSDIDEAKDLGAPLMKTGAGFAGNVVGNVAAAAPLTFVPGANTALGATAIGGIQGLMQPVATGESGLTNTALGAGFGLGGFGLGKALGAGVSAAKNKISSLASERAKATAGLGDVSQSSLNKITKQFKRDKVTKDYVLSQLDELGPNATLADVGGANTAGLSRAVASSTGEGKDIAARVLNARQTGQSGRVSKGISDSLGSGELFHQNIDDLLAARSADSARFYEKAVKGSNLIPKSQFAPISRDDFLTGIMEKVKSDPLYKLGGLPNNSMKIVDQTKKYIDRMIHRAKRGDNPNNYEISRLVEKSKKLRDIADDAFPDYKLARQKFAGPTELVESLENGRQFIKGDAEVTKAALDAMSESERQFFRIGAARALRDKVLGTPDTADTVKKIFNTPLLREKLQTIFPGKKEFDAFEKMMRSEAKMFQTRSNALSGSRTAPLLDEMADAGGKAADAAGILLNLARGNIGSAAIGTMRKLTGPGKLSPRESAELGNLLFAQGPLAKQAANVAFGGVKQYQPGLLTRGASRLGLLDDPSVAQGLGLLGPSIYASQQ